MKSTRRTYCCAWWTLAKGEQAYKDVEINRDRMHIVLNPLNADLAAAEECRLLTRFPRDMHQRIRTAIFGADRDDLMRLRNVGVVSTATAFFVLTSRLASPPATPTCASALPSGLSAGCTPAFRLQTNGMAIHTYGPHGHQRQHSTP